MVSKKKLPTESTKAKITEAQYKHYAITPNEGHIKKKDLAINHMQCMHRIPLQIIFTFAER